jgi:protein-S-isoprenylcysteine O-methyltransferase Ste14
MASQRTARRVGLMRELASENRRRPRPLAGFLARRRVPLSTGLFALAVVWLLAAGPRPHSLAEWRQPAVAAAGLLLLAGLGLRSWAAGVLRKNRVLTTTGPYRLCRHPLYLGSLLLTAGFCLLIADVLTAALVAGPILVLFRLTVRREEEWLAWFYGDAWQSYARSVPALLPVGPLRLRGSRWSPALWLHNEEYRAVGLVGGMLLGIELVRVLR